MLCVTECQTTKNKKNFFFLLTRVIPYGILSGVKWIKVEESGKLQWSIRASELRA